MFPLRKLSLPMSLALGVCTLSPAAADAQVTYFQRPPTAEQLRAALLAPASARAAAAESGAPAIPGSGSRTRGIVWQNAAEGGAAPAAAASAASALPANQALFPVATAKAQAQPPAPQPRPVAQGAPAAALPINFDVGSSRVARESTPYIESIASLMRSDPSIQLVIEGHTDARGSYNRNMVLSWDRALGVYRSLVESYGVEPKRLQPVGKGPLEPMPGTDPDDGANRRVQFRISG